jgi:GNS1/SUR4 family
MDHPVSTIQFHLFLVLVGVGINIFMKSRCRQGFPLAKSAHRVNNNVYALFSALLCLSFIVVRNPESQHTLGYVYHLSKFHELLDIYLFLLSGYIPNSHFAIHHATTPLMTADSVISQAGTEWRWPAITNTIHHFFMYSFFGGRSEFRLVFPITGTAQLLVGIWTARTIAAATRGEKGSIALVLYLLYWGK